MKRNADEYPLLMAKQKSSEIHIGESFLKSSDCGKLLGIQIDSKLHF